MSGSLGLLFSASFVVVFWTDSISLSVVFLDNHLFFKSRQNRKRLSPVMNTMEKLYLDRVFKKSSTRRHRPAQSYWLQPTEDCPSLYPILHSSSSAATTSCRRRPRFAVLCCFDGNGREKCCYRKPALNQCLCHGCSCVCVYCSTVEAARMGRPASLHSCCC